MVNVFRIPIISPFFINKMQKIAFIQPLLKKGECKQEISVLFLPVGCHYA
jgi:hypothetical protein